MSKSLKKWIRKTGALVGAVSAVAAYVEVIPGKVGIVAGFVGGFLSRLPAILDELAEKNAR